MTSARPALALALASLASVLLLGCGSGGDRSAVPSGPAPAGTAASAPTAKPEKPARPCDFPTQPGTYKSGEWEYVYEIGNPGTQSERRTGRLLRNGVEVTGKPGEVQDTPLGQFLYFGKRPYNIGWLNTVTYDQPVFGREGRVLPRWYMLHLPTEAEAKAMSEAVGVGITPRECQPGPDRRVYCPADKTLLAFDSDRKLIWKHETKYAVFISHVTFNGRGDVLVASVGKGDGGELWCLSADGKVRWRKEVRVCRLLVNSRDQVVHDRFEQSKGRDLTCLDRDGKLLWRVEEDGMCLQGVDASDTILVNCGAWKSRFTRLYSADGRVIWSDGPWEVATNQPYIGAGGNYVAPGRKADDKEKNAP